MSGAHKVPKGIESPGTQHTSMLMLLLLRRGETISPYTFLSRKVMAGACLLTDLPPHSFCPEHALAWLLPRVVLGVGTFWTTPQSSGRQRTASFHQNRAQRFLMRMEAGAQQRACATPTPLLHSRCSLQGRKSIIAPAHCMSTEARRISLLFTACFGGNGNIASWLSPVLE